MPSNCSLSFRCGMIAYRCMSVLATLGAIACAAVLLFPAVIGVEKKDENGEESRDYVQFWYYNQFANFFSTAINVLAYRTYPREDLDHLDSSSGLNWVARRLVFTDLLRVIAFVASFKYTLSSVVSSGIGLLSFFAGQKVSAGMVEIAAQRMNHEFAVHDGSEDVNLDPYRALPRNSVPSTLP